MDKEQYYKLSTQRKLPMRCPILNYCMRRAYTVYFFSDYSEVDYHNNVIRALQADGSLPSDFEEKKIAMQGEANIWSKGRGIGYYYNMCPEVNLFDAENALPFAKDTASTDGDWDYERSGKSFINRNNKHFSECAEFCKYQFENKPVAVKKAKAPRRAPISSGLRFEILSRDNYTCQYCGANVQDGAKLELDHKIPYSAGGKDSYENLITSCKNCNLGKSNKII